MKYILARIIQALMGALLLYGRIYASTRNAMADIISNFIASLPDEYLTSHWTNGDQQGEDSLCIKTCIRKMGWFRLRYKGWK